MKVWLQKVNAAFYIPYNSELTEKELGQIAREVFKMKSDDIDFFQITLSSTIESTIEEEEE